MEAVSIRAGQACFIQGMLTAWRVHAKKIALEDRAKAYIMVQESEQLELARTGEIGTRFVVLIPRDQRGATAPAHTAHDGACGYRSRGDPAIRARAGSCDPDIPGLADRR